MRRPATGYVAEQLAEIAITTEASDWPDEVVHAATRSVVDTVASILGGVPTDNATQTRFASRAAFGDGQVLPWFTYETGMHSLGALLSNCAAASALDIDDGHRGAAGHPGAAIVPAALMEAERLGRSGSEALEAIIVGYQVALLVGSARRLHADISFASGIWTGYGVAAAVARLRKMSAEKTAHAIAIAGAEAPQNLPQGACTASSVKGSSPWSTLTAYLAIARAEAGATGSLDLLDREVYDWSKLQERRAEWQITRTYFKPYAACRYAHPVIDAVLKLRKNLKTSFEHIDRIEVEIFPEAAKLPNSVLPSSLEDAQFSLPFTTALAALRGGDAFLPMLPQMLRDEEVIALSQRVVLQFPERLAGCFPHTTPARVTLVSGDDYLSEGVEHPLGDPANPMSDYYLGDKLAALGKGMIEVDQLHGLSQALWTMRQAGIAAPFSRT